MALNNQTLIQRPKDWEPKRIVVDPAGEVVIRANTATASGERRELHRRSSKRQTPAALTTRSTFLVIARDETDAYSATSGLNDHGIAFEVLAVPAAGTTLPDLTSANSEGNYGGIVVLSEVSYSSSDSTGYYTSALTPVQWNALYEYQRTFGVRMVRLNVVPGPATGTSMLGGCCDSPLDQLLAVNDTSAFPGAGLVVNATLSTKGLYHYPAVIVNSSVAIGFATFQPAPGFLTTSVAGVINDFKDGRKQMVFFLGFATASSSTSILLTHAWIHWATRGLFAGHRRAILSTQVDDMFLSTTLYTGGVFRTQAADLEAHKSWMRSVNAELPAGSNYTIEMGHNGNGNIGNSYTLSHGNTPSLNGAPCASGPIHYAAPPATAPEYKKPLGTGTSLWPATTRNYSFPEACVVIDPLQQWLAAPENRDAFMHVSHTFTHEDQELATYFDAAREVSWNQAWLAQAGISQAAHFSGKGLIPPAITGLHNGDVLRAWADHGIVNVVGDNTRKVLLNEDNEHWPLVSNVENNSFAGIQITPRWASNIYYNCDTTACDTAEWTAISQGSENITNLLTLEQATNTRHLLSLHHDPHMFHQANMRQADVQTTTVPGAGLTAQSGQWSLLQMWVETVLGEFVRVVNWPVISLKHDDIAASFARRMARDRCSSTMVLAVDASQQIITGVTISSPTNLCSTLIPVTVPGTVNNTQDFVTEQLNPQDPLTIWVPLEGIPVTLTLDAPIPW